MTPYYYIMFNSNCGSVLHRFWYVLQCPRSLEIRLKCHYPVFTSAVEDINPLYLIHSAPSPFLPQSRSATSLGLLVPAYFVTVPTMTARQLHVANAECNRMRPCTSAGSLDWICNRTRTAERRWIDRSVLEQARNNDSPLSQLTNTCTYIKHQTSFHAIIPCSDADQARYRRIYTVPKSQQLLQLLVKKAELSLTSPSVVALLQQRAESGKRYKGSVSDHPLRRYGHSHTCILRAYGTPILGEEEVV